MACIALRDARCKPWDAPPSLDQSHKYSFPVVIFNRGRIEQQGSPEDIIKKPRTPFIMKFVGDTNIVPATSQVGEIGLRI
eukprot:1161907-Pelagomonas_calceolata.AAC.12